ncbi:MAG: hypothetical protein AAGE61_19475 [Pseudomonadota bacterium]
MRDIILHSIASLGYGTTIVLIHSAVFLGSLAYYAHNGRDLDDLSPVEAVVGALCFLLTGLFCCAVLYGQTPPPDGSPNFAILYWSTVFSSFFIAPLLILTMSLLAGRFAGRCYHGMFRR